jgi:hypothetical protein
MDLKAISLGTAVPSRNFNAVVHSVFPEAVNLRAGKENQLLTLVKADGDDLPQGIRLETPTGFSFETELHQGERLACRDGILQDEHRRLSLNLRQARRWKCKLPDLSVDGDHSRAADVWTLVWEVLNERQRLTGVELRAKELFLADVPGQTVVARKMGVLVRKLCDAACKFDPQVETTVTALIGLGSGLTPSGDDFLVGLLTGLRCTTGDNANHKRFLSGLERIVNRLSHQTNDISRTYLFHATRGQVSNRLAALAQVIAGGENSDTLLPIAEEAMRVGHSSGMETVTGLLVGLSVWGNGMPSVVAG